MKQCPQCRRDVRDDYRFCPDCQAELIPQPESRTAANDRSGDIGMLKDQSDDHSYHDDSNFHHETKQESTSSKRDRHDVHKTKSTDKSQRTNRNVNIRVEGNDNVVKFGASKKSWLSALEYLSAIAAIITALIAVTSYLLKPTSQPAPQPNLSIRTQVSPESSGAVVNPAPVAVVRNAPDGPRNDPSTSIADKPAPSSITVSKPVPDNLAGSGSLPAQSGGISSGASVKPAEPIAPQSQPPRNQKGNAPAARNSSKNVAADASRQQAQSISLNPHRALLCLNGGAEFPSAREAVAAELSSALSGYSIIEGASGSLEDGLGEARRRGAGRLIHARLTLNPTGRKSAYGVTSEYCHAMLTLNVYDVASGVSEGNTRGASERGTNSLVIEKAAADAAEFAAKDGLSKLTALLASAK